MLGAIIASVGVAIAWLQLRRTPRLSTGPGGWMRRVAAKLSRSTYVEPYSWALHPPTGRLPAQVRGRVALLSLLTERLKASDGHVHVLAGLGGVGKSTVALSVAHVAINARRRVWWVDAVDAGAIASALLALARELGAASLDVDEAFAGRRDAPGLVWRYLEQNANWVLIFDNADDIDKLGSGHSPIIDGTGWVRPSRRGMVLITSRVNDVTQWGKYATVHSVPALSESEGASVLLDCAPAAGSIAEARQLSMRLCGLPLALHQAGSYLASSFADERTFTSFQESLEQHFERIMVRHGMDDRSTVMATWELSLDALSRKGFEDARPLLRILSCFAAASPVPYRLIQGIGHSDVLRRGSLPDTLSALAAVGLLETRASPVDANRADVLVHPLVAETQRARFTSEERGASLEGAISGLAEAIVTLDRSSSIEWPIWLQLLPHISVLLDPQRIEGISESTLEHLLVGALTIVDALIWAGRWPAALDIARHAVVASAKLGENHPATLKVRHFLAEALMNKGLWKEAEDEFRKVVRLRELFLGKAHPDTLTTRQSLGCCLRLTERTEEAEKEYKIVVEERRKILGDDDLDFLNARHDLAHVGALRGRTDDAEAEFRFLLKRRTDLLGEDHPSTLATLHDLSWVLGKKGDLEEAERGFKSVRDQWLRIANEKHPSVLQAEYELAIIHRMAGLGEEALEELQDVLVRQRDALGEFHPTTLKTRHEVATTLLDLGRSEDAMEEFRAVLDQSRTALGIEHPVTIAALHACSPTES